MVKQPKKRDTFASSSERQDVMGALDVAIASIPEDPILEQLKTWEAHQTTFRPKRMGDEWVTIPASPEARQRFREGFLVGSDLMSVPKGSNALANYRAELVGMDSGATVVGLGSTDYMELLRVANWMVLHNPLALNVTRALRYLTIGQGVTVSWPSSRGGSGKRKERDWKLIERSTSFQRALSRITAMVFTFGEWYVVPRYDAKIPGDASLPNRLLHVEPDRVKRMLVNEFDAEDVMAYEIEGADAVLRGKSAKDILHCKIADHGNVARGITPLLSALKYLRFAELFQESRHYLNLTRSRLPVIRKIKGSGVQIQREKARLTKLPPPGSIMIDPESHDWVFPSLNIGGADAADDWNRIVLAIAAAVGLPAHMVANDVSQGTYASTLITESPTIRMIEDYRAHFSETWMSALVRALTGYEDGFTLSFAPVVRRGIGELSQAVAVAVEREIISRRTGCEILGYDFEGDGGEQQQIEIEREAGFGAGAGFGALPPLDIPTELPNTRKPEPKTGAALGATGSQLPNDSAG